MNNNIIPKEHTQSEELEDEETFSKKFLFL
jgi:hypothetical protein